MLRSRSEVFIDDFYGSQLGCQNAGSQQSSPSIRHGESPSRRNFMYCVRSSIYPGFSIHRHSFVLVVSESLQVGYPGSVGSTPDRDHGRERVAASFHRRRHLPVSRLDPFPHPDQSVAATELFPVGIADSVDTVDAHLFRQHPDRQFDNALSVAVGIGHGLLNDAVAGRTGQVVDPGQVTPDAEVDIQADCMERLDESRDPVDVHGWPGVTSGSNQRGGCGCRCRWSSGIGRTHGVEIVDALDLQMRDRVVGRTRLVFAQRDVAGIPTTGHPTRGGTARVSTVAATMLDVADDIVRAAGIYNVATVIVKLSRPSHASTRTPQTQARRMTTGCSRSTAKWSPKHDPGQRDHRMGDESRLAQSH